MSKRAAVKGRPVSPAAFRSPYPPSWFDRFTQWIDRLPGPYWFWYLALAGLGFLVETVVQWVSGEYPPGTFRWLHLVLAANIGYLPGLMHYLDRTAGKALDSLRPALRVSPKDYAALRYRLTTLPAWSMWMAGAVGLVAGVAGVLDTTQGTNLVQISQSPLSLAFNGPLAALTGFNACLFAYHFIRQLGLVSDIYSRRTHINLFRLGPLYALSGVTARTAIAIVLPVYVWAAVAPALLHISVGVSIGVLGLLLAAAAFTLPLLGVHRLLVEEKERWISEASRRYESLVVQLHRALDRHGSGQVANCREGLAALEIELARLERVPTWPWQPQTVRGLIAALLLPIGVWLIQLVIQRMVGA
jgi:hypothetical protein